MEKKNLKVREIVKEEQQSFSACYGKNVLFQPFQLFFSSFHALSNYHKEIIALVSLAGNNRSALPCLQDNANSLLCAAMERVHVLIDKKIPPLLLEIERVSHLTKTVKLQVLYKLLLEAGNSAWFL